jgi:NAD+ kinase
MDKTKAIAIYTNSDKDGDFALTKRLARYAAGRGAAVYADGGLRGLIDFENVHFCDNICEKADFVVVLGGDGTMLRAARLAAPYGTPLLGINLGNLGYLTDTDAETSETALSAALNGEYKLEKRMMLRVKSERLPEGETALNDVCLLKSESSRLVELSLRINGEYIDSYRADGIIISTPTGSTAYNLSAGGPIAKPDSEMIIITPINPHKLFARSFVISANDTVTVKSEGAKSGGLLIAADGHTVCRALPGESADIRRNGVSTMIMKTNDLGFYDIVRKKLYAAP